MKILLIMLSILTLTGCYNREKKVDKTKLLGKDYRLFQDTPSWELAKAVDDEDLELIDKLVTERKIAVDYPEPRFGNTLLMQAIQNNDYKSVKALLALGADPNVGDHDWGSTAMHDAAENPNPKYLKLLLEYHGDPNVVETKPITPGDSVRGTPLHRAIFRSRNGNIDNIKLLVESGADVNFRNYSDTTLIDTPLSDALGYEKFAAALYLLEQGARYDGVISKNVKGDSLYILSVLRRHVIDMNSKEYKQKQAVIDFLKTKGLDYDKEPIPDFIKKDIIKMYPDNWQEYLKRY